MDSQQKFIYDQTKDKAYERNKFHQRKLQPAPTTSHHRPSCHSLTKYGRIMLIRSKLTKFRGRHRDIRHDHFNLHAKEKKRCVLHSYFSISAFLPNFTYRKNDDKRQVQRRMSKTELNQSHGLLSVDIIT